MASAQQVPVAERLFTWPSDEPRLIASERDGVISFPAQPGDPERLLGTRGTLWAFTTQQFRPPSPPYDGNDTAESFEPYALGYVELPGELLIQARFTENDPAKLIIGQEMELRIVPYTTREDGTEVLTYAFAPVTAEVSQ
ncbi:OB-fold domain-containing protein [Mycolicibacterium sp.]|uniref:Zn-ribbon domain-containing OB-fold protein n=1 Tax=Mycolicibacterium sp. TaxID=2320850 RepID=UPI001A2D7EE4|nr:OB-fold domain-containing protein [Mycolicibacterium sp.]MBJ7336378.1 OB-fold domain-containing protein [Mycolicibacterium sp.]